MSKKLFIILMSFLCTVIAEAAGGTYVIKGKISPSYDGKRISLSTLPDGKNAVSSALIRRGTFTFRGTADATKVYFLVLGRKEPIPIVPVFPEDGTINVTMSKEPVIGGTALNDEYYSFAKSKATLQPQYAALQNYYYKLVQQKQVTKAKEDSIENKWNGLSAKEDNMVMDVFKAHPGTAISAYLLYKYQDEMEVGRIDSLLNEMPAAVKNQPLVSLVQDFVAAKKRDMVGATYTDLAMKSPDGKDVKLSDYVGKNKYVMVDFWASWCGPCRAEMPNVVAAYAKYHSKGFEVVGVSFDEQHQPWVNALAALKMPWPQMSDLKGWQCAANSVYGINSIPSSIIIDQNGKIVAKNLRGDDLEKKLSELLQ